MKSLLKVERILDYYDVPQLFVARDVFDTIYICFLYNDELQCRYTGIRISSERLTGFLSGQIDLRLLFIEPETPGEYFDIIFTEGTYQKVLLSEAILPEDKLPAEGYMFSGEESENVVISIPVKDRNLLSEIVRKFGWACM